MSAPAYAMFSLYGYELTTELASQEDIAELAFILWQERGSPFGSPEEDWFEAERWLNGDWSHRVKMSSEAA